MNLKDFESNFDEKILERGKALYEKGAVQHIKTTYNDWIFKIEGKKYIIDVAIKKDLSVYDFSCTCPSARWNSCKHVAACLYYMREKFRTEYETNLFKSEQ